VSNNHNSVELSGFDEYEESLTDGLQVLRYNMTTAYVPHLDWIDDYGRQNEHDCESAPFLYHSVVACLR
jgi:hypothetical protein